MIPSVSDRQEVVPNRSTGLWQPTYRLGFVLKASTLLSPSEAYGLGEAVYSTPDLISDSIHRITVKEELRNLGFQNAVFVSRERQQSLQTEYQLTPTIILSFNQFRLPGPITLGQAKVDFLGRLSLTICPNDTKSKLWLRLTTSAPIPESQLPYFYDYATEAAECIGAAAIDAYNAEFVSKITNKTFERYFSISINLHSSNSPRLGSHVRRQVERARFAPVKRDQANTLDPVLEDTFKGLKFSSHEIEDPEQQMYLSHLASREPVKGLEENANHPDEAGRQIYTVYRLSVYQKFARVDGITFEDASPSVSPAASQIASSELASELGAYY